MKELLERERERRNTIWAELVQKGGPNGIRPSIIKDLRIHRGQQGVFRDQALTGILTPTGSGITVGVLHTGREYTDDLSESGVIYHYPVTTRGKRDKNEIQALKLCADLKLPLFVVIKPYMGALTRNVRIAWVSGFDDISKQVLLIFGQNPLSPIEVIQMDNLNEDAPFSLLTEQPTRRTLAKSRGGQVKFRFEVFKRYGPKCALCHISSPELLQAAHICPVKHGGTNDPRNGLVLCLNHHHALDLGWLDIEPDTLEITVRSEVTVETLEIRYKSLVHLKRLPHKAALQWLHERNRFV